MEILKNLGYIDPQPQYTKYDLCLLEELLREESKNFLIRRIPRNESMIIVNRLGWGGRDGISRSYVLQLEYITEDCFNQLKYTFPRGSHMILDENPVEDVRYDFTKEDMFSLVKYLCDNGPFKLHVFVGDPNHIVLESNRDHKPRWYLCTLEYIGDGDKCQDAIVDKYMIPL